MPKHGKCAYNQRSPFCVHFHKEEVPFVSYVFHSIKRYISFCFYALQEQVLRWMKPSTTSLVLSTLADLTRSKGELLAENALLRVPLIVLRRQVKRPVYRKTVNACVILRRDNFDHPFILCFLLVDYLQGSHSRPLCQSKDRCTPHPATGRLHLDALWWTAGAQTSEREIYRRACCVRSSRRPRLPQASRSYDLPPPLPQLAHS